MARAARRTLLFSLGLLVALSELPAQSAAPDDSLVGIWSSETLLGSALRGNLTVVREVSGWRASLSDATSKFRVTADAVRFAFPGNAGGFRGMLARDRRTIAGFWLQPAGDTKDRQDPGGSSQAFASPLVLTRAGRSAWRGTVQPLEDRFTLYLRIFRGEDGSLLGAFRNPEQGSHGPAMQLRVARDGDSVTFAARPDPAEPEVRMSATLLRSPDRLRIHWPDAGRVLELARRTPSEAAGFYPRPPGEPKYVYRQPPDIGDGWATSRAADAGMDEAALAHLVQRLIDADPSVRRPALIHSLLVAYQGKLVLEEYFFGFDRDRPHDLRSAGKSFSSVLLGAAMRRGARISPESDVYPLLAGRGPFANPDPRKSEITLAHLLTHTSGLACDDNDPASPGNEMTMQTQERQPDWWKYMLDLPVAHDPGSRYAYCSAGTNLVGAALTTVTRTWLPEPGVSRRRRVAREADRRCVLGQDLDRAAGFDQSADDGSGSAAVPGVLRRGRRRICLALVGAPLRRSHVSRLRGDRQRRPAPDRGSGPGAGGRLHGRELSAGRDLEPLPERDRAAGDHSGHPALTRADPVPLCSLTHREQCRIAPPG